MDEAMKERLGELRVGEQPEEERRRPRVTALIVRGDEVLLMYRHKVTIGAPYLSTIGGGIEPGDNRGGESNVEQQALFREVLEETHLRVLQAKLMGSVQADGRLNHLFLVWVEDGEPQLGEQENMRKSEVNCYELRWHKIEDVIKHANLKPDELAVVVRVILATYLASTDFAKGQPKNS